MTKSGNTNKKKKISPMAANLQGRRVLLPRLPEVQAVVMRALYIEGKEPQQVAREQRINVSSVYRRRDRGIANLHKLLVTAREVA